ncbi:Fur family transcriptional regulator [Nocardioides daejeonensis]|uniref:Fur family transcriptional regulator n=1 Tax=Nocardioides daejeonensis TaxID=1046556 RepID=UPI000D744416|nr:Fur family transcriptional regulator [Nocardioides daejeonensis]
MTSTEANSRPSSPEANSRPSSPEAGRPTKQRLAVARIMDTFEGFRSAQEVHTLLATAGETVGLATVYRALQRMAEAGEVDTLRTEEGELTYRRCSTTHHHHLVCRACGATVEIEGPAVERWAQTVSHEHGYVDVSHTLEIFGTCADCARVSTGGR